MLDKYSLNDESRTICQAAASAIILGKKWTSTKQGGYFWRMVYTTLTSLAHGQENDSTEFFDEPSGHDEMKVGRENRKTVLHAAAIVSSLANIDTDEGPYFWAIISQALLEVADAS